jgi:hypothetical protein
MILGEQICLYIGEEYVGRVMILHASPIKEEIIETRSPTTFFLPIFHEVPPSPFRCSFKLRKMLSNK